MLARVFLVLAINLSALHPAWANGPGTKSLSVDITGDGLDDFFILENYSPVGSDFEFQALRTQSASYATALGQRFTPPDSMANQSWLQINSLNELQAVTSHTGIGRGKWELTLTLAFRFGAPRVVGVTYAFWDSLNLTHYGQCDVNLLTGIGIHAIGDGQPVSYAIRPFAPTFDQWDFETILNETGTGMPFFCGN